MHMYTHAHTQVHISWAVGHCFIKLRACCACSSAPCFPHSAVSPRNPSRTTGRVLAQSFPWLRSYPSSTLSSATLKFQPFPESLRLWPSPVPLLLLHLLPCPSPHPSGHSSWQAFPGHQLTRKNWPCSPFCLQDTLNRFLSENI